MTETVGPFGPVEIQTVLVVDDEPDIRRIAQLSLRNVGRWRVLLAGSGDECLAVLEVELPDVILLDVMMPGMDGPTILLRLRDDPRAREIPVLFVTAKAQRAEVARFLALGAAGVITKPFDPLSLPAEIRRVLAAYARDAGPGA